MQLIGQLRGLQTLQVRYRHVGWRLADSSTPIQPLIVGDNEAALSLSQALENDSIRVTSIGPPTVPNGTSCLRITLSASHTAVDVTRLLDSLSAIMARPGEA